MRIYCPQTQEDLFFDLDQSYENIMPPFQRSVSSPIDVELFKIQHIDIDSKQQTPFQKNQSAHSTAQIVQQEFVEPQNVQINLTKKIQAEHCLRNDKGKSNKKKSRRYSKKVPDYKKNICGYITKKIVKQATSQEYRGVINRLCRKYYVSQSYFLKTFKNFQNITGPTHLYSLVKPRIQGLSLQDKMEQIGAKRVFRIFFIWFLRYRYMRYIIRQGKMQKKDIYIKYKNKQLLHLITQEGELFQDNIENQVRNLNIGVNEQSQLEHGTEAKETLRSNYRELARDHLILNQNYQKIQKNYQLITIKRSSQLSKLNYEQISQQILSCQIEQQSHKTSEHQMKQQNIKHKNAIQYRKVDKSEYSDSQYSMKQKQSSDGKTFAFDQFTFQGVNYLN